MSTCNYLLRNCSKVLYHMLEVHCSSVRHSFKQLSVYSYSMEKENQFPAVEPPRKRKRLSLNNKDRFKKAIQNEELSEASKGVVPENTNRRNSWAARNFMEWAKKQNRGRAKRSRSRPHLRMYGSSSNE